jgi:succinate dehydrogenase flavin-adding protein (antitoxin of CptAB toxin-antitoxin module)
MNTIAMRTRNSHKPHAAGQVAERADLLVQRRRRGQIEIDILVMLFLVRQLQVVAGPVSQ